MRLLGAPALHRRDNSPEGFGWIEGGAAQESVLAYARYGEEGDAPVVVICNFTPVERSDYLCGLPRTGRWREILNTDAAIYGGADRGNMGGVTAEATPHYGQPASARVVVPPLSAVFLVHDDQADQ